MKTIKLNLNILSFNRMKTAKESAGTSNDFLLVANSVLTNQDHYDEINKNFHKYNHINIILVLQWDENMQKCVK